MPGRIIAIGDIHGYGTALAALLEAIKPRAEDTLVALGDYVDRGPEVPRVIDAMIALADRCRLVPLLGNHDEMVLELYHGGPAFDEWVNWGGQETLLAYGCAHPREIPARHIEFLEDCVTYHETERHLFVHASYDPELPLEWQAPHWLRWASIRPDPPGPHRSGKIAIVGHTVQRDGRVLDLGHLICIDTGLYCGGWLTALDVATGTVWQADAAGRLNPEEFKIKPTVT
jgi:serine/threonine protein phosphatase 1